MSDPHIYEAMNHISDTAQQLAHERPLPFELPNAQRESLRKLPFERMHNFRDLGGYRNDEGRSLKWGQLYRSDKISGLAAQDQHYLERLGLRRIVDFRSPEEREAAPHSLHPESEIAIHPMPISVEAAEVDKMLASLQRESTTPAEMENYLLNAYQEMVERFTPVYRSWMAGLLDPANYPQVFHCSAGKDRTGFAAAVLLRALGVHPDTIMEDYLATNHFTAERIDNLSSAIRSNSAFPVKEAVVRALFSVQPRYLDTAFATISKEYGDFERYLERGLELSSAKRDILRELLLEG
jgi:protein-tyrosine phosphatase